MIKESYAQGVGDNDYRLGEKIMKYQTIITTTNLANSLDSSDCLILDCRGGVLYDIEKYETFIESHIPDAFYFCYSTDSLTNTDKEKSNCSCIKASNKDQVTESLNLFGFDRASQIVIYDNETSSDFTSSVWLFLRSIGYQNVAVLQGGYPLWEEQGMPVSKSDTTIFNMLEKSEHETGHFH